MTILLENAAQKPLVRKNAEHGPLCLLCVKMHWITGIFMFKCFYFVIFFCFFLLLHFNLCSSWFSASKFCYSPLKNYAIQPIVIIIIISKPNSFSCESKPATQSARHTSGRRFWSDAAQAESHRPSPSEWPVGGHLTRHSGTPHCCQPADSHSWGSPSPPGALKVHVQISWFWSRSW